MKASDFMYINNNFFSPNYSIADKDTHRYKHIILHYTEMLFEDALAKLMDPESQVSCHYLIKEDGEILQLVEDHNIAWHAGKSSWQGMDRLNQSSIGIELDNPGNKKFPLIQMESCVNLCRYLVDKYGINTRNIIGHSDIAPERKIDPGIFFDWRYMAKNGLGVAFEQWSSIIYPENMAKEILYKFGDRGANIAKLQSALKQVGYKIEASSQMDVQTNAVIRAFQSHFCPENIWHRGGVAFYSDLNSFYDWDKFSNEVLKRLI